MSAKYFPGDDTKYLQELADASRTTQVPIALLKAVIAAESSWQPRALRLEPQIGDASRGLMQLLAKTARNLGYQGELGPTDPAELAAIMGRLPESALPGLYNPRTNIQLGAALLAQLLRGARPTHGDTPLAVAVSAYNAGYSADRPGDAKRTASGMISNQAYVTRVLGYFAGYGGKVDAAGRPVTPTPDIVLPPKPEIAPIDLAGATDDISQQVREGLSKLNESMTGAGAKASTMVYIGIILAVLAALAVFVKGKL